MYLCGMLLQAFRMQLTVASDPGTPLSKLRARLCAAVHKAGAFARAIQLLAERRGTQRSLRCQLYHIYGHDTSTSNVRDATRGNYSRRSRPLKNGEGLPAAYEGRRRQPHPFHHVRPSRTGVAPHRRRSTRTFELPDTTVEEGCGAYPPTTLDCGTTNHRHPRFGQLHEEGERGVSRGVGAIKLRAEEVPSRAIRNLLPHARTADEGGEPRGLFDGNIRCGATDPTGVRQDAAVRVANGLSPAGKDDSGVKEDAARSETKQARPLDKGSGGSIYPPPDRLEATCCFLTCVRNGESLARDCLLNPQQFHTGA
ncbi:hypothetical protein MOQ_002681 [Trypanosoma cruzi marinkellei]|uniref:Uncharacterized protein n=1 Tax=Trypanosoma cruzi marinkellei TaxID=85056 RepID=K2NX19_TRYCR|nr:hypothetical protein MOQ_002681 [Trypanosoma cruzi marinkellei]